MTIARMAAQVNEARRLSAQVSASIHPGPVTVLIVQEVQEDEAAEL